MSDICRTTSVSGIGNQTPDSYIATSRRGRATSGSSVRCISPDQWRRIFGNLCGDIGVRSLVTYAGNGSGSADVAVIYEVTTVHSLHIPPVAVVGRLLVAA